MTAAPAPAAGANLYSSLLREANHRFLPLTTAHKGTSYFILDLAVINLPLINRRIVTNILKRGSPMEDYSLIKPPTENINTSAELRQKLTSAGAGINYCKEFL
jgi:hypothetical protein